MLQVWWVWSHCHWFSTQDTSFRNLRKSSPTQTSQELPCQINFKAPPWRQGRQSQSRSQPHFHRHCRLSHHESYRGCSRSQHQDNCSHHMNSSWCSCFTYKGYSHQSHCNTPHQPHYRSSTHKSSLVYHSKHHIRSCSWPSYKSSRQDLHRSSSHSSRSQEKPKDENWRSTHGLLQLQWTFHWPRRGIWPFKLTEPSPSSDSHEQGGLPTHNQVTVALIMDRPTITIHAGRHYKALIDSGAAISFIRYSTYQLIDDCFKTPIQPTTTKLNTADWSPMTALGMTELHLRIADFKFTHNFIICDRLQATEIIFWIDIQKKFSLLYAWDKEKNCYIQKDGRFLTYTRNCEQKSTLGIVKSTLKIPLRHNDIIPIKIKSHTIMGHMAYFISDQDSTKGKDPNINIINGIHNIKGKTSVNVPVSTYTNNHITFIKWQYAGHLEPTIEDIGEDNPHFQANPDAHTTNSITTQWMMAEQVEPDTSKPPCDKLKQTIEAKL